MGEYGRAVRFAWSDAIVEKLGNDAPITIYEFTNSRKAYVLRLGHLRNALLAIDGKQPTEENGFRNLPNYPFCSYEHSLKEKKAGLGARK